MKRIHAIVHGLVQGVFFRAHAQQWANSLGLKGFARNLPDGSVEVVAEGSEEALKQLIAKLKEGPRSARVEKVEVEWQEAAGEFNSFSIRY